MFVFLYILLPLCLYLKELSMDPSFPILMKYPYNYKSNILSLRFFFPQDSFGITYNQYIGVIFPESLSKLFSTVDFDCELSDSNNIQYKVKSITSQYSLIENRHFYNVNKENNTLYCHFLDNKVYYLQTGSDILYTLKIIFNKSFPSVNFYDNIGLVTKTYPSLYGLIIDSLVIAGNMALYSNNEYNYFTPINKQAIALKTWTSNETNIDVFEGYYFEIKAKFGTTQPVNKDHLFLLEIDTTTIDIDTVKSNLELFDTNDNISVYKIKYDFGGTYSKMVSFSVLSSIYFKIKTLQFYTLKSIPVNLQLLYQNSYSIIQESSFEVTSLPTFELPFDVSTPYDNVIYRNGAWKFRFNFTYLAPSYDKNVYIRIYHNNAVEKYNELTFIQSSCMINNTKKTCYNDRNDLYFNFENSSSISNGSGFFFSLNSIEQNQQYVIDILAYADNCGGVAYNNTFEYFTFSIELYDKFYPNEYYNNRFKEEDIVFINTTNYKIDNTTLSITTTSNQNISVNTHFIEQKEGQLENTIIQYNITNEDPIMFNIPKNMIRCYNNRMPSYSEVYKNMMFDSSTYKQLEYTNTTVNNITTYTITNDIFLYKEVTDFEINDKILSFKVSATSITNFEYLYPINYGFYPQIEKSSVVVVNNQNVNLSLTSIDFIFDNTTSEGTFYNQTKSILVNYTFNQTIPVQNNHGLFSSFDLLITFGYNTNKEYIPSKIIRFISMFPFSYHTPKISEQGRSYTSYQILTGNKRTHSVCAIKLDKEYLQSNNDTSNTLLIWLLYANLFEVDYSEESPEYPVYMEAGRESYNIRAYQSVGGLTRNNYFALFDIEEKKDQFDYLFNLTGGQNNLPYHFFMGNLIVITDKSKSNSFTNFESDLTIPYYCNEDSNKNDFSNKHYYNNKFPFVLSVYGKSIDGNLNSNIEITEILKPQRDVSIEKDSIIDYNRHYLIEESSLNLKGRNDIIGGLVINNTDNNTYSIQFNDLYFNIAFLFYQKKHAESIVPNTDLNCVHYNIHNTHSFYVFGKKFDSILMSIGNLSKRSNLIYSNIDGYVYLDEFALFAFNNDLYGQRYFYSNFMMRYNKNSEYNYFKLYNETNYALSLSSNIKNGALSITVTSTILIDSDSILKFSFSDIIYNNSICLFHAYPSINGSSYTYLPYECEYNDKLNILSCVNEKPTILYDIVCKYIKTNTNSSITLLGIYQKNKHIETLKYAPINSSSNVPISIRTTALESPSFSDIRYYHTSQANGIGILEIKINVGKSTQIDNSKIIINGNFSQFVYQNFSLRCLATFDTFNYETDTFQFGNKEWNTTVDRFIETCDTSLMNNSIIYGIVVTTKKMVYFLEDDFSSVNLLTIILYPVIQRDLTKYDYFKSTYRVVIENNDNKNLIKSNSLFQYYLTKYKYDEEPIMSYDGLCNLNNFEDDLGMRYVPNPKIPGMYGDYYFTFFIKTTNTLALINEFTIFFPHEYYLDIYSPKVKLLCTSILNEFIPCMWIYPNVLNIRLIDYISTNSQNSTSITIKVLGIPNPYIIKQFRVACTANYYNSVTLKRKNIITGNGIILDNSSSSSVIGIYLDPTTIGNLKYVSSLTEKKNSISTTIPGEFATYTINVGFDQTKALSTITNEFSIESYPYFIIEFPPNYDFSLYYYFHSVKITSTINVYKYHVQKRILSLAKTITPTYIKQSSNRIEIYIGTTLSFGKTSLNLDTAKEVLYYFEISLNNIKNPIDFIINQNNSSITIPYIISVSLTNKFYKKIYRSYLNLNSFIDNTNTYSYDKYITSYSGFSYEVIKRKWDVYVSNDNTVTTSNLNEISLYPGRFTKVYFILKNSNKDNTVQASSFISLIDNNFKTLKSSYNLITSLNKPIEFHLGIKCDYPSGTYYINFALTNINDFNEMSTVKVNLQAIESINQKSKISVAFPSSVTYSNSYIPLYYTLSEPNVNDINVKWTFPSQHQNELGAIVNNIAIPPQKEIVEYDHYITSKIYSIFTMNGFVSEIRTMSFTPSTDNICYYFAQDKISIKVLNETYSTIPFDINDDMFTYYSSDSNAINDPLLNEVKNAILIRISPPVDQVNIKCALTLSGIDSPSREELSIEKETDNVSKGFTLYQSVFYNKNDTINNVSLYFLNLVKNQLYTLKCLFILPSLDNELVQEIELGQIKGDYIKAPKGESITCYEYSFASKISDDEYMLLLNKCQEIFISKGYEDNGCYICMDSSMSKTTPGFEFDSKVNSYFGYSNKRLRNLDTQYRYTICPVYHYQCKSNINQQDYIDFTNTFYQMTSSSTELKQNFGISSSLTGIRNFSDTMQPDISKVEISDLKYDSFGYISFKLFYETNPMQCFWKVKEALYNGRNEDKIGEINKYYQSKFVSNQNGITKLLSILQDKIKEVDYKEPAIPLKKNIYHCYDPSWCGVVIADNPAGEANNELINEFIDIIRPFEPFKKYFIYLGCKSNMPYQSHYSDIIKIAEFISYPEISIDLLHECSDPEGICDLSEMIIHYKLYFIILLIIFIS